MAGLCTTLVDREQAKFKLDSNGETCVNVCGEVNTDSTSNIAGLVTIVAVNSATWTALPATSMTSRKALAIQNQSAIEVRVNYDSGAGYVGMIIPAGGERFYNITESITIYARSASGTPSLAIEELS